MPNFVAYVELHRAEPNDYTKLHREMTKQGFSQASLSGDGAQSGLSSIDYQFRGASTRAEVLKLAAAAAATVKPHYEIRVVDTSGSTCLMQLPPRSGAGSTAARPDDRVAPLPAVRPAGRNQTHGSSSPQSGVDFSMAPAAK